MKNPAETFPAFRPWALAGLSGLLLLLAFPRFDFEILAWGALVPLFFAIQNQPLARATWLGFVSGLVFYFFGLFWITNTLTNYGNLPFWLSVPVLALLASYLSFYVAIFCHLLARFGRDNALFLFVLAPPLWTGLEYLRSSHPDYGFSWLGLGYSQYLSGSVIQLADITGVYGVSALIVLVNAALFYVLRFFLFAPAGERGMPWRVAGLSLLMVILALGYGQRALGIHGPQSDDAGAFKVALVQGNIPQHQKWDAAYQDRVISTYRNLTLKAAGEKPGLIVWPEAATPYYYSLDPLGTAEINTLALSAKSPLLIGSPFFTRENERTTHFNSAFLVSAAGEAKGRYDKIHLVPFGEFVPFQSVLFFVRKMVATIGDFGKGKEATVFEVEGIPFGVSICYEITFPDLVRQPVKNGARFLVNITNDAWFGKSAASYQHMAMAALRAVENRVPIVRAANTGISGVIDADGRLRDTTELFTKAVVVSEIVPNQTDSPTLYARVGDVFSWACLGLSLVLLGWGRLNVR